MNIMSYLHQDFNIGPEKVIEVQLDKQANVILLDDGQYQNYRGGRGGFRYYGGLAKQSPFRISPPHYDHWHLVIDLGGTGGTLRHAVRIIG